MIVNIKILGALGVMMISSTASWSSGYFGPSSSRGYDSDPEEYTHIDRGNMFSVRGDSFEDILYGIPRCDASEDLRADLDASVREEKRVYTREQLLRVRASVEPDPRIDNRLQTILGAMDLSEIAALDNEGLGIIEPDEFLSDSEDFHLKLPTMTRK